MKTLNYKGQNVTNTFQYQVFQTQKEAIDFGVELMGWDKEDILHRILPISINVENVGIVDANLNCIMVDSGSDDYVYYIN